MFRKWNRVKEINNLRALFLCTSGGTAHFCSENGTKAICERSDGELFSLFRGAQTADCRFAHLSVRANSPLQPAPTRVIVVAYGVRLRVRVGAAERQCR